MQTGRISEEGQHIKEEEEEEEEGEGEDRTEAEAKKDVHQRTAPERPPFPWSFVPPKSYHQLLQHWAWSPAQDCEVLGLLLKLVGANQAVANVSSTWFETFKEEMKALLGINILMGIHTGPAVAD